MMQDLAWKVLLYRPKRTTLTSWRTIFVLPHSPCTRDETTIAQVRARLCNVPVSSCSARYYPLGNSSSCTNIFLHLYAPFRHRITSNHVAQLVDDRGGCRTIQGSAVGIDPWYRKRCGTSEKQQVETHICIHTLSSSITSPPSPPHRVVFSQFFFCCCLGIKSRFAVLTCGDIVASQQQTNIDSCWLSNEALAGPSAATTRQIIFYLIV